MLLAPPRSIRAASACSCGRKMEAVVSDRGVLLICKVCDC